MAGTIELSEWRELRGYAFGRRQRTVIAQLRVRGAGPAEAARVDAALARLTGFESPAVAFDTPPRHAQEHLARMVVEWHLLVQRQHKLPVFEQPLRTRQAADAKQGVVAFWFALPYARFGASAAALRWVVEFADACLAAHGQEEVAQRYGELAAQLLRAAPPGTNAIHFLRAAFELGVQAQPLPGNVVALGTGRHTRWLDSTVTDRTPHLGTRFAGSKSQTCALLRSFGLPVARNAVATDVEQAVKIAQEIGYPVVVKPDDQEQGRGVAAGLAHEQQLRAAYPAAEAFSRHVLVERHHDGADIRFTVAGAQVVKIMAREAGGVTGDGRASIAELVRREQATPRLQRMRREHGRFLLDLDDEALGLLREQGLTPGSVPAIGQAVPLRRKNNISAGGSQRLLDAAGVHPDNIRLALRAAEVLRLDIAGIDLITPDPARSWTEVDAVITEVNARPQIGISLAPEVYPSVLRGLVGEVPHVPVHLRVAAPEGDDVSAPALLRKARECGVQCVASRDGLWIDGERVAGRFASGYDACTAALLDTRVESLLCVLPARDIAAHGLPAARLASVDLLEPAGPARADPQCARAVQLAARSVGEQPAGASTSAQGGPAGPAVSIVTPTFNRAAMLAEAVRSVQAQDFRDWELVIVDDGSDDDTPLRVREWQTRDPRIVYARQPNRGSAAARNLGIRMARGSYIAFLDSDDRYLPGGLHALWSAISASAGRKKLVYGDYDIVDEARGTRQPVRTREPQERPGLYLQFLIPRANPILPSACIVERDALLAVGGFDESFRTGQVVELWGRFVRRHDIHRLPRAVTLYRAHDGQITREIATRRHHYDRNAMKLFDAIPLETWFPGASPERRAQLLERLASRLVSHRFVLIDTAIHLLRIAQRECPDAARARRLAELEQGADALLRERYGEASRVAAAA